MKKIVLISVFLMAGAAQAGSEAFTVKASSTNPLVSCYGGWGPEADSRLLEEARAEVLSICSSWGGKIQRYTHGSVTRFTQYPSSCTEQTGHVEALCLIANK